MADRTLTINHADGDSETYTIKRDKFAGVREMSVDGSTVTVDRTAVPKEQSKETTFGGSQSITIKRDIDPLLSKVVGGAPAAYSLRDLNDKAGNNKVVRVRRSSDNAEKDFTAKEVSNGTLTVWVGAGNDGFVESWYDQSGEGNDAVQLTAGSQPKIVDAGVLVTKRGKPAFNLDGVDDKFQLSSTITNVGDFYISLVSAFEETAGLQTILGANTNSDYLRASSANWQLYAGTGAGDTGNVSWSAPFGSLYLMSFNRTGATVTARLNGSSAGTGTNGVDIGAITKLFQRGNNTSQLWKGTVQELILYTSDQTANREAIEANINNQYDIY